MTILLQHAIQKRLFNPKSASDLKEYRHFKTTSAWKKPCPFYLEWPYADIPTMIQDKIIKTHLGSLINHK